MADSKHRLQRKPRELRILAFGNSLTQGYCDFGTKFHPYGPALQAELTRLLSQVSSGASTSASAAAALQDTKVTVTVNGLSGDCVLRSLDGIFLDRLSAALDTGGADTESGYDFVALLGGTNDLAYTFSDPTGPRCIFEQGLRACYELVLRSGASLVCLTVPERLLDTRDNSMGRQGRAARVQLNGFIEQYVKEQGKAVTAAAAAGGQGVYLCDIASKMPFVEAVIGEEEGFWSLDGLHMTATGYDNVGKELAQCIADILRES